MKDLKMSTQNINSKPSTALSVAMFGGLLIITFSLLLIYLPTYVFNNPPVCKQEAVVQEILAINGNEATVKLKDGKTINHTTEKYNLEEKKFITHIKVNESICLSYENPLGYYLSYILVR